VKEIAQAQAPGKTQENVARPDRDADNPTQGLGTGFAFDSHGVTIWKQIEVPHTFDLSPIVLPAKTARSDEQALTLAKKQWSTDWNLNQNGLSGSLGYDNGRYSGGLTGSTNFNGLHTLGVNAGIKSGRLSAGVNAGVNSYGGYQVGAGLNYESASGIKAGVNAGYSNQGGANVGFRVSIPLW
jgi:hypothetical protein